MWGKCGWLNEEKIIPRLGCGWKRRWWGKKSVWGKICAGALTILILTQIYLFASVAPGLLKPAGGEG